MVPGRPGAKFDGLRPAPQTEFVTAAIFGDSGSPVIDHDGGAIGVLVAISIVPPATTIASDLGAHLRRAEEATGIDFEVVTAPLH